MSNAKRLAILPGAFDPIHEGHVSFALEAVKKAKLDRVYFLIEPRPRHKQGVKAFEHRLAMTQLATAKHDKLGVIIVDHARFTVDETWQALQKRFSGTELTILLGSDVAWRLANWPKVEDLASDANFIIAIRKDQNKKELLEHLNVIASVKHTQFRAQVISVSHPAYTSKEIRAQLRRSAQADGLNREVLRYITKNKLYVSDHKA